MGERAATVSRGARFSIREEDRPATHALGLINVGRSVTALIENVFGVHASCLSGPGQSYPVGRPHSIAWGSQGQPAAPHPRKFAGVTGPRRATLPRRPGPTLGAWQLTVPSSGALTVNLPSTPSLPLPWPGPSGGLAAESSTCCWGRRGAGGSSC
jgi:hypothetical protein